MASRSWITGNYCATVCWGNRVIAEKQKRKWELLQYSLYKDYIGSILGKYLDNGK